MAASQAGRRMTASLFEEHALQAASSWLGILTSKLAKARAPKSPGFAFLRYGVQEEAEEVEVRDGVGVNEEIADDDGRRTGEIDPIGAGEVGIALKDVIGGGRRPRKNKLRVRGH